MKEPGLLRRFLHPDCHRLPLLLLESGTEGAVTAESAFKGQLLCGENTLCGHGLMIKTDEMTDAEPVDVCVVGKPLPGKVLAQVIAIGANLTGKLRKGNLVLQIEPAFLAMLFQ